MTELALAAPFLLAASLYGIEVTWLTITHMRVNQVAVHVSDNASRIGDISTLEDRKIYESDINDLFLGAQYQLGDKLDLYGRGRIILSSLETVPDSASDQQYIHWQRCKGRRDWASSYGDEGDGYGNPGFQGMGTTGNKVQAEPGGAVMFVEIAYDYDPIFSAELIGTRTIKSYSAYTVRADRDLTQIYQKNDMSPDPISDCTAFDDFSGNAGRVGEPGGGPAGPGSSGGGGGASPGGGGPGGGGGPKK